VGGEFNLRRKPHGRPFIVLSYPDAYEIGISNPGLQILYAYLNDATAARCERAYCPWPDMASLMRQSGVALWTLESGLPVRAADLWGITLPHELTYTNVLEMLDLAAVPLHAEERGEEDPIVLGGGPATANPAPLARFFDAFFVGEVEGRLDAIVEAMSAAGRAARLRRLADIPGVWLPGIRRPASRQVFMGFSSAPPVTRPLVPLLEAVHDRAVVEVMRGCTAGCRYCQAGMWYRPVRERPVEMIVAAARDLLRQTGCDEVSLISLSSCDYTGVEESVRQIRALRPGVRVSLPSLRLDSAAMRLAQLGSDQRGSVTLAPEAGTQRLRDAINKRVDDEMLIEAADATFRSGFGGLKLYFMIGLPGETDEDVTAIAALTKRVRDRARARAGGRARLAVAVSSFVPKAWTPFQWETLAGLQELERRQALLRGCWPHGVKLAFHDARASVVEAALARGDEETGAVLEAAWRRGARFDAWSEWFSLERWEQAAVECGVSLHEAAATRGAAAAFLPWTVCDALVDEAFLTEERVRAEQGRTTDDCRAGACAACGVCTGEVAMDLVV